MAMGSSASNNADSDYQLHSELIECTPAIELQNKHPIDQSNSLLTQHLIFSIDDDDSSIVNICVTHHEKGTIFHRILSEKHADWIVPPVQSQKAGIIGFVLALMHCLPVAFFSNNVSWFAIIFRIFESSLTVPASILYFGTMNQEICIKILKQFTFWFKMFNVLIVNAMKIIWANDHLEFALISKTTWFCTFGVYVYINLMGTTMICLVDCFKWPGILKIGVPLLIALQFGYDMFWWYGRAEPSPAIEDMRHFAVRLVAFCASFNAAVFFLSQFVSAARHCDRASVLRVNAVIKWN